MKHTHTTLSESGTKAILCLQEAIGILDSAERWRKEDLASITPFLSIIKGTVTDTKYRLAQTTIQKADKELKTFCDNLSELSIPEDQIQTLRNVSLPQEIKTKQFFETTLSAKEYAVLRGQITDVIQCLTTVLATF